MSEPDELQRLRRQLRAMASLNEQLRAQLEAQSAETTAAAADPLDDPAVAPPPLGAALRRGRRALDWVNPEEAEDRRSGPTFLVVRADEGTFLVEDGRRRRVRSGLLGAALEQLLGERRPADDDEFASWPDGAPVEVLEGPAGPPFVVVGGRRLEVVDLPLPHGVEPEVVDRLAEGPKLELVAGMAPRRAGAASGREAQLGSPGPDAHLVTDADGIHLIDGDRRRPVDSGLLVAALEQRLGGRRPARTGELEELAEGPPVQVLEGRTEPPFVVVGGRRLAVRGLPLPHPIDTSATDRLPEGAPLELVRSVAARRRDDGVGWLSQLTEAPRSAPKLVIAADGTVYVLERDLRRAVTAGLLVPALEEILGPRVPITDDDLAAATIGPPVAVLESRTGPPFVVLGGVRHPVSSLPLPVPVDDVGAARLPPGPDLDMTTVLRQLQAVRQQQADREANPDPVGEVRALVTRWRRD